MCLPISTEFNYVYHKGTIAYYIVYQERKPHKFHLQTLGPFFVVRGMQRTQQAAVAGGISMKKSCSYNNDHIRTFWGPKTLQRTCLL